MLIQEATESNAKVAKRLGVPAQAVAYHRAQHEINMAGRIEWEQSRPLEELVIGQVPPTGAHLLSIDLAETLDAAHELSCGQLPMDRLSLSCRRVHDFDRLRGLPETRVARGDRPNGGAIGPSARGP